MCKKTVKNLPNFSLPFPLEEEAVARESVESTKAAVDLRCCFAMTDIALIKSGEFIEIPGIKEYGMRRTGAEVASTSKINEYVDNKRYRMWRTRVDIHGHCLCGDRLLKKLLNQYESIYKL